MSSIQGYPSFVPQTQSSIMLPNVTGSSNGSFRGYSPVISHISNLVLSSSTGTTQTSPVYNPMMSQHPTLCQPVASQAFIATPEVLDDNACNTLHLGKPVVSSPLRNISLQPNSSVSISQQNTPSLSVVQQSTPSTSLPQQVISSVSTPSSPLLSVSSTQQHDIGTSSPSLPLPSSSPISLPSPSSS
ncbi:hypothetical protein V6N11_010894 [Hibiscus sabdariffa]|uniref:Uncharacterized protein n=1 Tax=Hibiscus sabdariffa TaxID=183260 RepID=A0ABR2S6U9_9ROSI